MLTENTIYYDKHKYERVFKNDSFTVMNLFLTVFCL